MTAGFESPGFTVRVRKIAARVSGATTGCEVGCKLTSRRHRERFWRGTLKLMGAWFAEHVAKRFPILFIILL